MHGQGQIVLHRLIGNQAEILEDDADGTAHQGDLPLRDHIHVEAVDHYAAGGGDHLAGQDFDDGGLTGAGGPHQKHEFPVFYIKGDALEGIGAVFIGFDNVLQTDHM